MSERICEKCNNPVADNAIFCNKCGVRLNTVALEIQNNHQQLEEAKRQKAQEKREKAQQKKVARKEYYAKNKKRIITLSTSITAAVLVVGLILMGVLAPLSASTDGFSVRLNDDGTVSIDGYHGNNSVVEIPSEIWYLGKNRAVTSIGDWAFSSCTSLTSIVIPDSVTTIGHGAFYNCNSLTSVVIPDSVTRIGDWAFDYCSSVTSVTIGDSVTYIGDWAFDNCSSLTSVTIGDSVTTIGDWVFDSCDSLTDVYYGGTKEQWNEIEIEWGNDVLNSATIYYYSDCIHDSESNQWRYDSDGNVTTELTVGEWTEYVEATCTTNGSEITTCFVCGEPLMAEIPATDHIRGEDGKCTLCGEEILYTITNDVTYAFVETDGILQSTNHDNGSSSSYVITAYTTITITFEYKVSSESAYDYFYIYHNYDIKVFQSGTSNSYTSYSITLNAGDKLRFEYTKDSTGFSGDDCCYIKNLTITTVNN